MATRAVNSAAPQLIIISRPSGSATRSRRSTSAGTLISLSPGLNHQGWVLFTDGAYTAASTTNREISAGELAWVGSSPDGAQNTFTAYSCLVGAGHRPPDPASGSRTGH